VADHAVEHLVEDHLREPDIKLVIKTIVSDVFNTKQRIEENRERVSREERVGVALRLDDSLHAHDLWSEKKCI
jgi:hypothetical protein